MKTEKIKSQTKDSFKKFQKKNKGFRKEFIDFINRGNVMDLAVGIVVGSAFTAIVTSLVNDIIMPIVGLVAGGVDFSNLAITIPNFFGTGDQAIIAYGNFIQNIVNFLIIAFVVFLMVKVINKFHRNKDDAPATVEDKSDDAFQKNTLDLLSDIRDSLKKK